MVSTTRIVTEHEDVSLPVKDEDVQAVSDRLFTRLRASLIEEGVDPTSVLDAYLRYTREPGQNEIRLIAEAVVVE